MRTYLDCMPCFAQQALDAVSMATNDADVRLRVMRRVLRTMADFPMDAPPLCMAADIHRLVRTETRGADPYAEAKRQANAFALGLLPELQKRVRSSARPFETALRLAIAGNIMDWGARHHTRLCDELVGRTIEQTLAAPITGCPVDDLERELEAASSVLYLADNAGEIVLDMLFLSRIPCHDVTVAVKGGPIINDATMADAEQIGLCARARVVSTGSDIPGTVLEDCSPAFRERFAGADLIIAKGQANCEALSDHPGPIFLLLKAKCPVIARDIGCEVGDALLLRPRKTVTRPVADDDEVQDHARV